MNYNLALSFHRRALRAPLRSALWVDGKRYSYKQLGGSAGRIARWLIDHKVEGRVGILSSRSLTGIAGILGSAWAGKTFVALDPSFPRLLLLRQIKKARLGALIVDPAGIGRLDPRVARQFRGKILAPERRLDLKTEAPVFVPDRSLAYLVFTSGSTGEPKAVSITAGNFHHYLDAMRRCYRLRPSDRLSQFFRLTFDLSLFDLFMAWNAGACSYVVPDSERMCPASFIRRHRLTLWYSTPSSIAMMNRMNSLKPGFFPSLRLSLFCGESLPESSVRAWTRAAPRSVVENLYGLTETTGSCLRQIYRGPHDVTPGRGIVAIGKPVHKIRAAVLGPNRRLLKSHQTGELALSGPQVGHAQGNSIWHPTGDSVYRDGRGVFHYMGRLDRQVKIRGYRVELDGIEVQLRQACGSQAAAAVAWPQDGISGKEIVAFVADGRRGADAILKILRQRLPSYMIPSRLFTIDRLPLTPNGKTDYRELARRIVERTL